MTAAWALHTAQSLDAVNAHYPALASAGLLGIAEQDGVATLYFGDRRDDLPLVGRWEPVEDRDYNAVWMSRFSPVTVGALTVVAPWHDRPAATTPVVIQPAQAFGTGHHETTQLCLQALQRVELRGARVFDVGTGSGILALAASALGAEHVLASDTDPLAVEAARGNAAANGLPVTVVEGSTDAAHGERFDVVVANLDTATLTAVVTGLVRCLEPAGVLIASGVSLERVDEALDVVRAAGLAAVASAGHEWAVITAKYHP